MEQGIRDHLRVNDSAQRPIEWDEIVKRLEFEATWRSERRVPRALGMAAGVVALAILIIFGLVPLFGGGEEPATPTPETPLDLTPEDPVESGIVTTRSDGPLGLSIEWTRIDPSDSALWSGVESDQRLFPSYLFENTPTRVASIGGKTAFALRSEDGYQLATSADGFKWEVESFLPGSPASTFGEALPHLTSIDGRFQSVGVLTRWPVSGTQPMATFAYHDGSQWHEGSYPTEPVAALVAGEAGFFDQYWACLNPDGSGGIIRAGLWRQGGSPEFLGHILVNRDTANWITSPTGPEPVVVCLEDGFYAVSAGTILTLEDDLRWSQVSVTSDIEEAFLGASQQTMWSSKGRFLVRMADQGLLTTTDFEDWETVELPPEANAALGVSGSVIVTDLGWVIVDGPPWYSSIPGEGMWISPDGQQWEMIPRPEHLQTHHIAGPANGMLVAHLGTSTRDIWIGRIRGADSG